jgi:hypothetical protein
MPTLQLLLAIKAVRASYMVDKGLLRPLHSISLIKKMQQVVAQGGAQAPASGHAARTKLPSCESSRRATRMLLGILQGFNLEGRRNERNVAFH